MRAEHLPVLSHVPDASPRSREVITIGFLSIDPSARCAWLRGQVVSLTALELGLLVYLARRPGHPVSVWELLRQVWQCNSQIGGTTAQVKNCVKRLRQKIELDPKQPCYVLTVRGHGYRMLTQSEWEHRISNDSLI